MADPKVKVADLERTVRRAGGLLSPEQKRRIDDHRHCRVVRREPEDDDPDWDNLMRALEDGGGDGD